MGALEGPWGMSQPGDRARTVILPVFSEMGLLAGDTERGGGGRKDAKAREHSTGRAEGLFSAPGFVAQFFWLCPSLLRPENHPHFPHPSRRSRCCWGPSGCPSTALGTGSAPVEEAAQQLTWGLQVTGWSQTQEGAQHISRELSITSGRTALAPRCLRMPGCQGPAQRAASGAALQQGAHAGWGFF